MEKIKLDINIGEDLIVYEFVGGILGSRLVLCRKCDVRDGYDDFDWKCNWKCNCRPNICTWFWDEAEPIMFSNADKQKYVNAIEIMRDYMHYRLTMTQLIPSCI